MGNTGEEHTPFTPVDLKDVIECAVNGTLDEDSLGYYPGGDIDSTSDKGAIDRNVVSAAFHLLGQTVAGHAHPLVAYPIIVELIDLRNATIRSMRKVSEITGE